MPKSKTHPKPPDTVPKWLWLQSGDAGGIRLEAALPLDGEKPPLRRFSMTAYTGGAMQLAGWRYPVVVDLAGMRVSRKNRPILKDHDAGQIVGHTSDIAVTERTLEVGGVISGTGVTAQEIIATSENGFPWQASIGATADKVVFITEGKTTTANGREFTGPVYVARKSTLGEISFVALGADDDTWAQVAAGASRDQNQEVTSMEFEQWAVENNFAIDEMDSKQVANLKAMFEKLEADEGSREAPAAPVTVAATALQPPVGGEIPDPAAQMRAQAAAESRRIAAIRKICDGDYPEIEAKAIEEGWDETKTELAVLRATRPKAPAIHSVTPACSAKVLEAAACMSLQFDEDELARKYGEQTMEAARPMRHIGLKELVAECARLEGLSVPRVFGKGTETINAGFSTVSLPGILENVMNKTLLASYEAAAIAAFDLCSVGTVSDFKEVSRYRLLGTGGFERVAPDGELKHGKLGEDNSAQRG